MKKLLSVLLVLLLLTGCGGGGQQQEENPTPTFTITDEAYDCTADELVLAIREAIENTEGYTFTPREIPLPSDQEPDSIGDYTLRIIPRRLFLDLDTTDDGRVDSITLRWSGGTEDTDNAGLISFCLIHMFLPSGADETVKDFGYAVTDQVLYEKTSDGSYLSFLHGDKIGNHMEIRPSKSHSAEE